MKQEATESLLINQLRSRSLLWSLHVLLDLLCSVLTRDATVEHAPRPAISEECTSERMLFREILLNARLLCCRVVSARAVRVGVIMYWTARGEARLTSGKGKVKHHVIQMPALFGCLEYSTQRSKRAGIFVTEHRLTYKLEPIKQ
jgi:hypothetical protein